MQTAKRVIPVRDLAWDTDSRVTKPMKPDPRLLAIARGEIDPEASAHNVKPTVQMPAVRVPALDPEPEDPFGGLILVEDDEESPTTMAVDDDMFIDDKEPEPFSIKNLPR